MRESPELLQPTVAVIGGGPAGLSAAKALAPRVEGQVLVVDRERAAGGIPRHSDHLGYGVRDRRRFMSGPRYARKLVAEAEQAGAEIMTQTMVTGWSDDETVIATRPAGRVRIRPQVFCFATGARERPRTARLIPGTRPAGILTTGQLQNWVHLGRGKVGEQAVVIGAELVSWSAVLTLSSIGCRTEALISAYPKGESYSLFRMLGGAAFRTKVQTNSRVVRIQGKDRVTGVEVEDTRTGARRVIECDTAVFTGDWIPDNELLALAGVALDDTSRAPVVDAALRTSKEGIFAVGNVTHPVETADVVALEGEFVAERILEHLDGNRPTSRAVRLVAEGPLRWVSPSRYAPMASYPPRGRLVAWVDEYVPRPVVTVSQGGRVIARRRLLWPAAPGRALRIPASVLDAVSPDGSEEVRLNIH